MPTKKKPGGGGGGNDGPRKGAHLMDQFGIGMNMKEFESMLYDDDDIDDDDVMAELAALNGDDPPPKVTRNARRGLVTFDDINKMASESLRDIPSDEELSDSEDADLLLELSQLNREESPLPPVPRRSPVSPQQPLPPQLSPAKSPKPSRVKSPTDTVSVLKERMAMYKAAIDTAGDRSKQRRLNRGIKTLEDLLRSAQAGRSIEEDSIPPPVSAKPRAPPSDPSPATVPDKLPTEETMPDSSPPQLSPPQASPPEIPARIKSAFSDQC